MKIKYRKHMIKFLNKLKMKIPNKKNLIKLNR